MGYCQKGLFLLETPVAGRSRRRRRRHKHKNKMPQLECISNVLMKKKKAKYEDNV